MADCNKIKRDGVKNLVDYYNGNISDVALLIEDYEKKGLDPTKFNPGVGKDLVNLIQLVEDFEKQKLKDISEFEKEVDENCSSDTEALLQSVVDYYTEAVLAKYTKGLSLILPKHMKHIDVKEILDGKPLGGKNSMVNKFRDDVLKNLGLGDNNDITKIVKDPVKQTKKIIEKIIPKITIKW